MNVLMLHNKYQIRGGEEESTEAEVALLKKNGVNIDVLYIDNSSIKKSNVIKTALNSIWSRHYYRLITNKLREKKYDIVHVQNFFPLFSPSIFYACQKSKVKVVMSVRNYRLICPNALLYLNGSICHDCVGKTVPLPAVKKKCYRDSRSASGALGSESFGTCECTNVSYRCSI